MKTIFFGASSYVLPLITFLKNNYDLALVVTTESKSTDAVPRFCTENNIPFVSVVKLDEQTLQKIKEVNAPFAVLADFRLLIKQAVIDIFPKGIINIHPSLLPEYRGPTPGTTALLDGKTTTGVSLMLLDKDLDHGPILGQVEEKVEPNDTSVTLYERLFGKGVELLEKYLPSYLEGKLEPIEQDHSKATYTKFLKRESGLIDLQKTVISSEMRDLSNEISHSVRNDKKYLTPQQFDRMVRAYFPWPGVWTLLRLSAQEGQAKKEVRVKFLPNKIIQMEGKKPVSYKDFINGYPEAKAFLEKFNLL